jgi:hypothetical protein
VTPWYQLTRLVWWPRSLTGAFVLFAVLGGLPFGLLVASGLYPGAVAITTPASLIDVLVGGLLAGTAAGWFAGYLRRGWAEMEGLGDVERLVAIRAVHFGTDVGSSELAAVTLEFARWQRAKIDAKRQDPIVYGCIFFGAQFVVSSWWLISRGAWLHAVVSVGLSAALITIGWRGYRAIKGSRTNLWNAEWYAAQRLGGQEG